MTDHWDGWPVEDPSDPDDGDLGDAGHGLDGPDYAEPPEYGADDEAAFTDDMVDDGFGDDDVGYGASVAGPADDEAFGQGWRPDEPGGQPLEPVGYADEPLDTADVAGHADGPAAAGDWDDGGGQGGPETVEAADIIGADPDPDPGDADTDDDPTSVFPPPLDLAAPPEPVDGPPWADASLLGDGGGDGLPDPAVEAAVGSPTPAELSDYAGQQMPDGADWADLIASPDPATSALARFWSARG